MENWSHGKVWQSARRATTETWRSMIGFRQMLVLAILLGFGCGSENSAMESTFETTPSEVLMSELIAAPSRELPLPEVSRPVPHQQLNQNAPESMQDSLKLAVDSLPGVFLSTTQNSLSGSVGWILDPRLAKSGPPKAFTDALEWGHSHRPVDGSMHLFLPPAFAELVISKRWGEPHQETAEIAGDGSVYVLVFGPRDATEFEVVWLIVQAAYGFATGQTG